MDMSERESVFIDVYDAHADALFRLALFSVNDRELAKDLVADTFMKVWGYLAEGNVVENLRAFCYRTLKNLIIDHWRKKGSISLDLLTEAGFDPIGEDGRKSVERAEEYKVARDAISSLPAAFREVIHLRYVEGYTPKEIAELLEISQSLVSVRLFRGSALLKKKLKS
jgi:RNA polymerase sigma-70 factor (ECF subfamily)